MDDYVAKNTNESAEFKKEYEKATLQFEIADMIFDVREEMGLNQTEFAKVVKKPRSTIARIENATMEPSLTLLNEILNSLGKQVEIKVVERSK
jgi:DNA-binding XRE family transcriptional regulator